MHNSNTTSRNVPPVFDWHEAGTFVVVDESGQVVENTLADSAYSARATHARDNNLKWSQAKAKGHRMLKLAPVAEVLDDAARQATNAGSGVVFELTKFSEPSGNVLGMFILLVPYGKKQHRLAHALLLTDKHPDITVKFPSRMTPDQLQQYSAALMLYQEQLSSVL